MAYHSFEDLEVWKRARALKKEISVLVEHLIDSFDEGFVTGDQLQMFRNKITEVEKVLNGYITWLERKSKEQ
ncbi:MAG: hypothetical protein QM640_14125 [Niabella sp.]